VCSNGCFRHRCCRYKMLPTIVKTRTQSWTWFFRNFVRWTAMNVNVSVADKRQESTELPVHASRVSLSHEDVKEQFQSANSQVVWVGGLPRCASWTRLAKCTQHCLQGPGRVRDPPCSLTRVSRLQRSGCHCVGSCYAPACAGRDSCGGVAVQKPGASRKVSARLKGEQAYSTRPAPSIHGELTLVCF
jgi:hypothetical protein